PSPGPIPAVYSPLTLKILIHSPRRQGAVRSRRRKPSLKSPGDGRYAGRNEGAKPPRGASGRASPTPHRPGPYRLRQQGPVRGRERRGWLRPLGDGRDVGGNKRAGTWAGWRFADFTVLGSRVLFNGRGNLWVTDGTPAGTSQLNVADALPSGLFFSVPDFTV